MQPLHYDLRCPAAKENSITHAAAVPSNLDAAITLRFAASRGKPARIYARGNIKLRQSCSHCNVICNHRFKKRMELRTQEQPLVAEHRGGTKTTAAATAVHTRYLSSPAAATLHGKTQRFVLRLPPHNTERATFMQPFQCDLQPQIQETHGTTHTGTTTRCRTQRRNQNDRSRNRRTHEVHFIAGRSPAFLPTTQSPKLPRPTPELALHAPKPPRPSPEPPPEPSPEPR